MAASYTFNGRAGIAKVERRSDADGDWWILSVRDTERRFGDEQEAQRAAYRAAFGAPEGTRFGKCELCYTREVQLHDVSGQTDAWPLEWVCGPCGSELLGEDEDPRDPPCGLCSGGCSVCAGDRAWGGP